MLKMTAPTLHEMASPPTLHELASPPVLRFAPETHDQYLTAVYTLWNLLDRIMYAENHKPKPMMPYGYMRRVQLEAYSRLAWRHGDLHHYCEAGVNGGHGTAAMLLANPSLVSHSFDEGVQPYSQRVFKVLRLYFGDRFQLHLGNSHRLLPLFAANASHRRMCDIILVDGDHSDGAYDDIRDFRPLAACDARLLLDDIVPTSNPARLNVGPQRAIRRARAEGILEVVKEHVYNQTSRDNPCLRDKLGGRPHCYYPWGWAIARYVNSVDCRS